MAYDAGARQPAEGRTVTSDFDRELEERLLRYAAIDSQSDETSPTSPSTARQFDMLRLLVDELREIGAADVRLTDYGTVLATIPPTAPGPAPTLALLAHVDTAPQFNATGVRPRVHRSYDGGTIRFPDAPDLALAPDAFPYLAKRTGDDIVTAAGTTLLGADDKAGVAIVMTAARHLLADPGIPHGPIRLAFTPDEEIGRGIHPELPKDLAADVAYTLDGADRGEICFESFSADKAVVRVEGVSIHPGWAKDKLVNALHLAAKIVMTLPHVTRTPGTTEGREGFIHLYEMQGGTAAAELRFLLRDHPAVPQHALLARGRHAPGRPRARSLPPGRRRALLHRDPRRHRRLAPDRARHPLPEHLHRHAERARPPRVGQRPGHGRRHSRLHPPRRALGRRTASVTRFRERLARRTTRLYPPARY
jgi:peptidase T